MDINGRVRELFLSAKYRPVATTDSLTNQQTRSTIAGNKHKRLFVVIFCAMGRVELKGCAVLWSPRLSSRGIAKTCV